MTQTNIIFILNRIFKASNVVVQTKFALSTITNNGAIPPKISYIFRQILEHNNTKSSNIKKIQNIK